MRAIAVTLLITLCLAKYEKWEVLPTDEVEAGVMYECKELNAEYYQKYKDSQDPIEKRKSYGLHVSVFPPGKNSQTGIGLPGKYIHSSWNKGGADWKRFNDYHWGWVAEAEFGADGKAKKVNGKKIEHKAWWPTQFDKRKKYPQSKYKPLKEVWELFVKHGYTSADGSVQNANLFLDATEKRDGLLKRYPQPNHAHTEYMDYYHPNEQQLHSRQYTKKKVDLDENHEHRYHDGKHDDTEASSMNVPTVIVTLVSFIAICLICTIYTGCIGIIAGAIGYKIKESQTFSHDKKVHIYQEV